MLKATKAGPESRPVAWVNLLLLLKIPTKRRKWSLQSKNRKHSATELHEATRKYNCSESKNFIIVLSWKTLCDRGGIAVVWLGVGASKDGGQEYFAMK